MARISNPKPPIPHAADADEAPRFTVVPRRHPVRHTMTLVAAVLLGLLAWSVWANHRFQWDVVGGYLFSESVLRGVGQTLLLTVLAAVFAASVGAVVAAMRISGVALLAAVASVYIWAFRGTPLLVQLLFWYNLGALYPQIGLGIPGGPQIMLGTANDLITPLTAAVLGLALNESAYAAEVYRGGILGVSRGQFEAAQSLGLTPARTWWHVVIPQALRIMIPSLSNNLIRLTQATSLVSVISMSELLHSVQTIYSRTYETIPLLIVAVIWYLVIVSALSALQSLLEQRLAGKRQRWSQTSISALTKAITPFNGWPGERR